MEISKIKIGRNIYDIKDTNAFGQSEINLEIYGQTTKPSGAYNITSVNIASAIQSSGLIGQDNDTKNTTGTINKSDAQLYIVGAQSQEANPVTYSNSACYIGLDNCLYTNGSKTTNTTDVTNMINTELYGLTAKPNNVQVVTTENIESIINNGGFGGIDTYRQLGYSISHITGSGNLIIPGTDDIYLVTVTANISSVQLQTNPLYGHSCHIIFKSNGSSQYTVAIANDNTNRICPKGSDGLTLTVPAVGLGYAEVDFLNTGTSSTGDQIYVKGM